jgi:hypothetical protein
VCFSSLAIVLAASTANAQWDPFPMKNVPRTADGKVDLKAPGAAHSGRQTGSQGFWMPTNPVKHLLNLAADLKPGEVPLQPWAEALLKERIETNGKDHPAPAVCRRDSEKTTFRTGSRSSRHPTCSSCCTSRARFTGRFSSTAVRCRKAHSGVDGLFNREVGGGDTGRRDDRAERQDVARHARAARH